MGISSRKATLLLAFFLVLLALPLFAIDLSFCQNLSTAGASYLLSRSVQVNGTNCFNVTAENVTLDCNGSNVVGNNSTNTWGIYSNQFNTTVRNCNISNFDVGIYFNTTDGGTIENNNISITKNNNVDPTYSAAIILYNGSNYNYLYNINASSAKGTVIYIYSSSNNNVTNSTGASSSIGISLELSSYNNLANFTGIANNGANGIGIMLIDSFNNNITNSTGISSTWAGIYLISSINNTISNSNGTATSGLGIYFVISSNNSIVNTAGVATSGAGFSLWASSNNNAISNCQIRGNDSTYGALSFYSGSRDNTVANSTINGNAGNYGVLFKSSNNWGNSLFNNTILNATILVSNTAGSNLTIDCQGQNMAGNNATGSYAVYTNQFNTTVRNCNISNFDVGIYFNTTDSGTIENNNISITKNNHVAPSFSSAIFLYNDSNYNILNNNKASSASGIGISLSNASNYNTIFNSTASSNTEIGISIISSAYNNVTNSFGASSANNGISTASSNFNTIANSTGTSTEAYGIVISSSSNNTVIGSAGIANDEGIRIYVGSDTNVTNSTGTSIYSAGIAVYRSTNVRITNSNGTSSSYVGIFLVLKTNSTVISNCTGISAANSGILIFSSANSTISGCQFSGISSTSGALSFSGGSINNTISNSTINGKDGIYAITLLSGDNWGNSLINNTVINATTFILNAGGSNLTIDCQWQGMVGTNTANSFGIYSSQFNTTIRNCRISNFTNAIHLNGSNSSFLSNNSLSGSSDSLLHITASSHDNDVFQNNFTGFVWINNSNSSNRFNDTYRGNYYYFANGTGAWSAYDIFDLNYDNWADNGSGLPFNATNAFGYWIGNGGDSFPFMVTTAIGNGSNITAQGVTNLTVTVSVADNTTVNGKGFEGNRAVNITTNSLSLIAMDYNFSVSPINFSQVSISNGTVDDKTYLILSGINHSAVVGGKTFTIYGTSESFNAVCIKNQETFSPSEISSTCTGENELTVLCNGENYYGMACTRSGTTLRVYGLNYSGAMQYQYSPNPAPATGQAGSNNAGGSRYVPRMQNNSEPQPKEEAPAPAEPPKEEKKQPEAPVGQPSSPDIVQAGEKQAGAGNATAETPAAPIAPPQVQPRARQDVNEAAVPGIFLAAITVGMLVLFGALGFYIFKIRKKRL